MGREGDSSLEAQRADACLADRSHQTIQSRSLRPDRGHAAAPKVQGHKARLRRFQVSESDYLFRRNSRLDEGKSEPAVGIPFAPTFILLSTEVFADELREQSFEVAEHE